MTVPLWFRITALITGILIVVVAALGGDPMPIAIGFADLAVAALPGIILGAVAGVWATQITGMLPVGGGVAFLVFWVVYFVIRYGLLA